MQMFGDRVARAEKRWQASQGKFLGREVQGFIKVMTCENTSPTPHRQMDKRLTLCPCLLKALLVGRVQHQVRQYEAAFADLEDGRKQEYVECFSIKTLAALLNDGCAVGMCNQSHFVPFDITHTHVFNKNFYMFRVYMFVWLLQEAPVNISRQNFETAGSRSN